jgi:hypothetical protein
MYSGTKLCKIAENSQFLTCYGNHLAEFLDGDQPAVTSRFVVAVHYMKQERRKKWEGKEKENHTVSKST